MGGAPLGEEKRTLQLRAHEIGFALNIACNFPNHDGGRCLMTGPSRREVTSVVETGAWVTSSGYIAGSCCHRQSGL